MKNWILTLMLASAGSLWAQDVQKDADGGAPHTVVDVQAMYPGGMSRFYQHVVDEFEYPARCMEEGIGGSVVLRFVVETDGQISNIKAVKETAACPEFTQEAIRVLRAGKRWKPAMVNGKAVRCYHELPISLQLE
ncbi:MAG: energy transducer TonB [Bacteroidia bacterium]